jgi:hypothetical protein
MRARLDGSRSRRSIGWWFSLVLGLAGLLAVVWYTGLLDAPLSSAGLNRNPCVVVALTGTKLCGDDARAWCSARPDSGVGVGLPVGGRPEPGPCDGIDGR